MDDNASFPTSEEPPPQSGLDSEALTNTETTSNSDNMEVHHHPELPHKGEKKNLKEYFLEFLMIFLAVVMGFIAESIREKMADHEKEKQYMDSMKEDVKSDTAQLGYIIKFNEREIAGIDSILEILKGNAAAINKKRFYKACTSLLEFALFTSNDRTMSQLKNAGGLRLISNQKVSDAIISYDFYNMNEVKEQGLVLKQNQIAIYNLLEQMLDFKIVKKYGFNGLDKASDAEFNLPATQENLNKLYNQCFFLQQVVSGYVAQIKQDKILGANLITFLNKEYKEN